METDYQETGQNWMVVNQKKRLISLRFIHFSVLLDKWQILSIIRGYPSQHSFHILSYFVLFFPTFTDSIKMYRSYNAILPSGRYVFLYMEFWKQPRNITSSILKIRVRREDRGWIESFSIIVPSLNQPTSTYSKKNPFSLSLNNKKQNYQLPTTLLCIDQLSLKIKKKVQRVSWSEK